MTRKQKPQIDVERVDDIPVVYGILERMGVQNSVDSVVTAHGNWTGLSPGWVTTIWLVHILSEENHLMEPVQKWVHRHQITLKKLTGQPVRELDFADDHLATCLRYLGSSETWHEIERQSGLRLIRVYDLDTGWMRLDATVGKVYHNPTESTLFQVGKAKNGLYETQFKLMLASLDPLGLPLVVDVEPGNRADDPLYIPSYLRAKAILARSGIFIVGDSKMGALLTRGTMAAGQDFYLVPLAFAKDDPKLLGQLLEAWLAAGAESTPVFRPEDEPSDSSDPDPTLAIAHGFEVTREQEVEVKGEKITWTERLLVVRSYSYMKSQSAALHRRLDKAEAALRDVTPPRARGKKQIQEKALLLSRIEQIETLYRVKGCFHYDYQKEVEEKTVRTYKDKSSRVERKVRYQLSVSRNQEAIDAAEFETGWRIYAANAPEDKLSLVKATLAYRDQIVAENVFARLHGRMLSMTPLYVQREDHAQGLIHLLTIAARALALGDYVAREALATEKTELAGIYVGNPKRSTARPTTERMLKAFEGINLFIMPEGEQVTTFLTDLTPVQEHILDLLGLHSSLFSCLETA